MGLTTNSRKRMISKFLKGTSAGLRKTFSFRAVLKQVSHGEYVSAKSGVPAGALLVRRIEKNPSLSRKFVSVARQKINDSLPLLTSLEKLADSEKVPMAEVVHCAQKFMQKNYSGLIDVVFDPVSYRNAIKKRLKNPNSFAMEKALDKSLVPANGFDSYLTFKRGVLQHLACKFGAASGSLSAYPFRGFNWEWYKKNFVSIKNRSQLFKVTDESLKADIAELMEKEGIKEGDFEGTLEKLKEVYREMLSRRAARVNAVKKLLDDANPRERRAVEALTYAAGESSSIDEEEHINHHKTIALLLFAAEKRGIKREKLLSMLES